MPGEMNREFVQSSSLMTEKYLDKNFHLDLKLHSKKIRFGNVGANVASPFVSYFALLGWRS